MEIGTSIQFYLFSFACSVNKVLGVRSFHLLMEGYFALYLPVGCLTVFYNVIPLPPPKEH